MNLHTTHILYADYHMPRACWQMRAERSLASTAMANSPTTCTSVLQCVAVCCSVLQCQGVAV